MPQPDDGGERDIPTGWLDFHRSSTEANDAGLTDEQFVVRSAPPSALSLFGLVRHMAEMEHVYAVWALGPDEPLQRVRTDERIDGETGE